HNLASRLLEKEVIFKEDLENIFGKRQWDDDRHEPLLHVAKGPEVKDPKPEDGAPTGEAIIA
ncbi:MAG: hypothetical protein RIQ89_218, partial [Bacteroidota bacterium]